MTTNVHNVTSVELVGCDLNNSGSRTLAITCDDGSTFEIGLFGETAALENLPKSATFRDFTDVEVNLFEEVE
ncbi:hypothetical protein [Cohaesibacter gelatinilyticus]|nr:hypothetical protein [Cohaesibacter gelatinilyticus]